jgi:hypothetical protein
VAEDDATEDKTAASRDVAHVEGRALGTDGSDVQAPAEKDEANDDVSREDHTGVSGSTHASAARGRSPKNKSSHVDSPAPKSAKAAITAEDQRMMPTDLSAAAAAAAIALARDADAPPVDGAATSCDVGSVRGRALGIDGYHAEALAEKMRQTTPCLAKLAQAGVGRCTRAQSC